jgi:hypothetical protein
MFHSFIKPSNLQSLPVEIICLIFDNLEMLDLLTCTRVNPGVISSKIPVRSMPHL